jgi:predicted dehydrogenase
MSLSRRQWLKQTVGLAGAATLGPYMITSTALGGEGRPAASNRSTMGCVGVGGRGNEDLQGWLGFGQLQVVAVCDVSGTARDRTRSTVDNRYKGTGCLATADFREITRRPDIDTVMIATPDHWHAQVAVEALRNGKDVFCEKPESLTIREGRIMVETARRYGRVFSGGSQRVWDDYNRIHRQIRGGAIGEVQEVWVECGGPSDEMIRAAEPVPEGMDWDRWIGPAPFRPFNKDYHPGRWRGCRDFSGGGMTDWGAHNFGGALFACNLHTTGPVEILPPDGKDNPLLTYVFANGIRMHHKGTWGNSQMSFSGTKGNLPARDGRGPGSAAPVDIQAYRGVNGIQGDFVTCIRTRERPFRDIEIAHRTVTVCHLGNLAYWLKRPLKWDPVKEEIIGDPEASRWLERPRRAPWHLE